MITEDIMTQIITNPYHLSVLENMAKHPHFNTVPILYIVERVAQMFPEYRAEEHRKALVEQVSQVCFINQDWS